MPCVESDESDSGYTSKAYAMYAAVNDPAPKSRTKGPSQPHQDHLDDNSHFRNEHWAMIIPLSLFRRP